MRAGTLIFGLSLLAARPLAAFEIEYSADRDPGLAACDKILYSGDKNGADDCYLELADRTDDIRIRAEATRAIGDERRANDLFRMALEQYPDDAPLHARWGQLFMQTYDYDQAAPLFQESLQIDPNHVPAILGLAEIAAKQFEYEAEPYIDRVFELEPDNIRAHLLLAEISLQDEDLETAETNLDAALETVEARGVSPLEVYALLAALDLFRGNTNSQWTQKALDINPHYGEIYATPANIYVITRRYREAIELYRKAIAIQPDLWSAHSELGVNLLRENKVDEAYEHLMLSYEGDPYRRQTVNTLRLIDSFEHFDVTEHGKLVDPESSDPPVILRTHKDETPVLEPYAVDLIDRTIATYTKRYDFELAEPVIAELYPVHDDFSVRTLGLPEVGLLGVTFGYLVAMDSPTARPEGEFHWGTTLWHEMAHVFTLEETHHLVPRWFSEGVSVFEEWATGPLPGRHIVPPFFQALADDKLLPVAELDDGFMRPSYAQQVIVSYMQAGLVCEYIADNFGQDKLVAMLHAYRDGMKTPAALEQATGLTPEAFDEQFSAHVEERYGAVAANLSKWNEVQTTARKHLDEEAWRDAIAAADESIELFPQYVDEGSAYLIKAKSLIELGEDDAALDTLLEYHRLGGYHPDALEQLAHRLKRAGRDAEALAVLEDLPWIAPFRESVHADLGDWLLEAGRPNDALAEYDVLMAMKPHDLAAAHLRLAKAYKALDDPAKSRAQLLYALEIAPHYREAQEMLLETRN